MELPIVKTIRITPKDYQHKLNTLPSLINRPIVKSHVNKMRDSMLRNGVLRDIVLVYTDIFTGKMKYYIADGQHLTDALVDLDATFHAKIVTASSLEDLVTLIADVNNTSKAWNNIDFLNAWCATGKTDYIYLRNVINTNKHLTTETIIRCYGSISREFKKGRMVIDKVFGDRIIKELFLLSKIVPINSRLVRCFIKMYKRHKDIYDSTSFMSQVVYNKRDIVKYISQELVISEKFEEMVKEVTVCA